jgi:3-isopropylmalate/(R)-2-methylmalate dehydratase small subunit
MRKLPTIAGGSGPRFVRHTGRATCVRIRDEEGELLAPDFLFAHLADATILVTPEPFETGAIETTLARIAACGVRAIVSPGFEPRFYQKCISSGVLALPLMPESVEALAEYAESRPDATLTIDLDRQVIELPEREPLAFEVEPRVRQKLLAGLTDMEEMLRHGGGAAALRSEDRKRRPWLYDAR